MNPHMRRLLVFVSLVAMVMAVSVPVQGSESAPPDAELEGRPIDPIDVGELFCDAIDYPDIECFASHAELDAAIVARLGEGLLESGYIRAYADSNFGGASMALDGDISNLGSIGWNNRISSIRSFGSESGTFYENTGYGGWGYFVCCNQQILYVGDLFNDQFSSFDT